MPATATLAQLADADHAINGIGHVGGEFVRDRWNQRAVVNVTDAPNGPAYYVNDSMLNVWRRGHAKLGSFDGNEEGPHYVIPQ